MSKGGPWRDRTTLRRRETWYREHQLDALVALTRVLNRERAGRGERITVSMLARIAVDLLLEQTLELSGSTETELRASVIRQYSTPDNRPDGTEGRPDPPIGTTGENDQISHSIERTE